MMKCENVQEELEAFLSNDIDDSRKVEIQTHLDECQDCSQALRQLTELSEVLQTWQGIEPSPMMYEKLKARMNTFESIWGRIFINPHARKIAFQFAEIAAIVILTLLASHWLRKPGPEISTDSTTINFYLKEHQGVVYQTASANLYPSSAAHMRLNRRDIFYYEFFDDRYEFTRPGIILRGPAYQRKIISQDSTAISNGHILTLSQARKTINFNLVAPSRLHTGYILDKIRKIEGRNSLHLLYTNGINTVSFFEQPLEERRRLEVQDFREYAVYHQNDGQVGNTILAWSDDALSFVLIGNTEMAQLMDMAQFINDMNRRETQ